MRYWLPLLMLAVAGPCAGQAVQTRLNVTGFLGAFGTVTSANYFQGNVVAAATTVRVTNQSGNNNRSTTVSLQADGTSFGGKPLADIQWENPSGSGNWITLTTSPTTIHSQTLSGVNAFWERNIRFRVTLSWVDDPPSATALSLPLIFRLTVAPP